MGSSTWPAVLSTEELQDQIRSAKILCVGAGGIGCELLKTLVCTGFIDIEVVSASWRHGQWECLSFKCCTLNRSQGARHFSVMLTQIDLDTIETSNLNRQFLFRKHHVGQSKAEVAAEVVKGFAPDAKIMAHHGNVKDASFDLDYFRSFDLVLNGLDNLEARRHVNRLCLAAEKPLIESGTAGYIGQVTVHFKGRTECFECQPKPTPKSFPICTLRNTPDRPIHCVVWAKDLLFARLFGRTDVVTDLDEVHKEQEGGEEPTAGPGPEGQEDVSFFLKKEGEDSRQYALRVFQRVFTTDIEKVVSMEDLWKTRKPPEALDINKLISDRSAYVHDGLRSPNSSASKALGLSDQVVWSAEDNARVFLESVCMFLDHRGDQVGSSTFDKDDDLAVDFVTSAANLRSLCYGIPLQSQFQAKGMAGNIIHAIATTNAVVAGLIVTEAVKVLAGLPEVAKNSYLFENVHLQRARKMVTKRLIGVQDPSPPAQSCVVCGHASLNLRIDTEKTTLKTLLDKVIKKALAVHQPTLLCGDFMYEEGEGLESDEEERNMRLLDVCMTALPGGGLRHGSILEVQDQVQNFNVNVIIGHQDGFDEENEPEGYVLIGNARSGGEAAEDDSTAAPSGQESKEGPSVGLVSTAGNREDDDDDDVCIVLDDPISRKKRGREDDGGQRAKRAKKEVLTELSQCRENEVICIDDV